MNAIKRCGRLAQVRGFERPRMSKQQAARYQRDYAAFVEAEQGVLIARNLVVAIARAAARGEADLDALAAVVGALERAERMEREAGRELDETCAAISGERV
jgi:hypothetical protein